jgi:hypothetical protein
MITWLCTEHYKKEQQWLKVRWGKHPLLRERQLIGDLSSALSAASNKHALPVELILSNAWVESRLEPRVLRMKQFGKRGERGAMQVLDSHKCKMRTLHDQIDCGAKLLRISIDSCRGDLICGVSVYKSGKRAKRVATYTINPDTG